MSDEGMIADIDGARSGFCVVLSVAAGSMRVQSSTAFPVRSIVKIEAGNRFWMGPVCACEGVPEGYNVELDIEAALNDAAAVDDLAARFRHERSPQSQVRETEPEVVAPFRRNTF